MRKAAAPRLKEADIQKACADFLALDGWWPLQTDPCSDRGRGKGFGQRGMADHLFLRPGLYLTQRTIKFGMPFPPALYMLSACGEILWVEFKRPGALPQYHQLEWHDYMRVQGFLTVIAGIDFAPTYDDFVTWYRQSGLLRREGL